MSKRASNELEAMLKKAAKRKETLKSAEAAIEKEKAAQEEEAAPAPMPVVAPPAPAPAPAAAASAAQAEAAEPTVTAAIFVKPAAPPVIDPLGADASSSDPLVTMLGGLDAEDPSAAQLLQGGWIQAHYARRPCPEAVVRWLFAVACHHRRPHVSAAAAHTLGSLLGNASATPSWVPRPADFLEVLRVHGATMAELAPDEDEGAADAYADVAAAADAAATSAFDDPRHNLLATFEVLAPCARWWSDATVDERLGAARWLLRLMLEPHAAPAFLHLQDALAAVLDGAAAAEWTAAWLPRLVQIFEALGARLPHSALVRLCGFLPPTLRAQAVQHRAAIACIRLLSRRRRRQHAAELKAARAAEKQKREERKRLQQFAKGVVAAASGEDGEDDDDDDDDDDGEEEGKEAGSDSESEASEEGDGDEADGVGAAALVDCMAALEVSKWKGRLDGVHSILLLVDLALSAEPQALQPERTKLADLKRRLTFCKNAVVKCRGLMDYHGLEAESLAAFLCNKVEHCFLEHR